MENYTCAHTQRSMHCKVAVVCKLAAVLIAHAHTRVRAVRACVRAIHNKRTGVMQSPVLKCTLLKRKRSTRVIGNIAFLIFNIRKRNYAAVGKRPLVK